MPKRGRPRKGQPLFTVKIFVEYTSDSDSDNNNVQHNVNEIQLGSLRSFRRHAELDTQGTSGNQPHQDMGISQEDQDQHVDQQIGERQENVETISVDQQQDIDKQAEERHADFFVDDTNSEDDEYVNDTVIEVVNDTVIEVEEHHAESTHSDDQQQPHGEHNEYQGQENDYSHLSDSERDFMNDEDENHDYNTVFNNLKSEWILTEIDHCVSKSASEAFWKLGLKYFTKLANAAGRKKKTPIFKSIRRKMYADLLPPVQLEIGYKNKDTGEIEIVKDTITPMKKYCSTKYEKLYEIGTVKVSIKNESQKKHFFFPI